MNLFPITFALATLLCSLVAGFLLAFEIVVMPGLHSLSDYKFLQAFKAIDLVIQHNQPVFMLVWLGSVVALVAAALLGATQLDGMARILLFSAVVLYLLGVQGPTIAINVPLNNQLQMQELGAMTETLLKEARLNFESRWLLGNNIRTIVAVANSALLISLQGKLLP